MDDEKAWFSLTLRQARRDADMSQRELARWSGVPKSVIGDAELGRATSVETAQELLTTLGYRLVIQNRDGEEVGCLIADERRDRDGRRFPPHLDVRELSPAELTMRYREEYRPNPLTAYTYRLNRRMRDAERYQGWYGEGPQNWLPPEPDREYVRMALGREPVFEWFAPAPSSWVGQGPFDRRAVPLAGQRAPALRRARAGEPRKRRRSGADRVSARVQALRDRATR